MGKRCIIEGDCYQTKLTEALKERLTRAVTSAIKDYGVTEFYFGNNLDEIGLAKHSNDINEFIAREVAKIKAVNKNISAYMVLAKEYDVCDFAECFDAVFKGEDTKGKSFVNEFNVRDRYLAAAVDMIFWYSEKGEAKFITLTQEAKTLKKKIIFI